MPTFSVIIRAKHDYQITADSEIDAEEIARSLFERDSETSSASSVEVEEIQCDEVAEDY